MKHQTPSSEAETLRAAALALGCDLVPAQVDRLLTYVAVLSKWNRIYNLTAVRSREEIIKRHLLDSLSLVAPIRRETGGFPFRLLDVGSGAGLPGAVVAAAIDHADVTCVDAAAKKVSFVQQVAGELALLNLRAVHSRVEDLEAHPFNLVTARAFAPLAILVASTRRHLIWAGKWVAMKGREPREEIAALPEDVEAFHVEHPRIPGLNAARCLVWIKRLHH